MITGILNVLKLPQMTSHDVIYFVRRVTGEKKVGHLGTLDPDAAGVLPVFIGQATKLIEYSDSLNKTYKAQILLGKKTDTGDDSGTVIKTDLVPYLDFAKIQNVLNEFLGQTTQIPPMYSALKYNGKKLYQLARQGQTVERKERIINIDKIKLHNINGDKLLIEVTCSKGTYIRTLIEDIAEKLGTCGTMTFLLRTASSVFTIENSATLEQLQEDYTKYLLPADFSIQHLPQLIVTDNQALRLTQGVKTTIANQVQGLARIYDNNNKFYGIGISDGHMVKPEKIFA